MEKVNIGTYAFGDAATAVPEKLKTAREIGYTGIEFLAQDMENPVEDLKAWLAEAGMECVSLHAGVDAMSEMIPKMAALGGKMIICPGHPCSTKEEALELARLLFVWRLEWTL